VGRGLHVGSIAGVQITLDWSLLIIFFLVAFSLGAGVFPAWHPQWGVGLIWIVAFAAAALFLASVLAHELSHALVGRAQGIEVRRITLFVFGGMAQMEGEPHAWRAELWMAIVGPITSLVIGLVCVYLGTFLAGQVNIDPEDPLAAVARLGPVSTILMWLGPINVILAVFNLVPGFPLDGGRVLRAILWGITGDIYRATRWAAGTGQLFAWVLIASGFAMILGLHVPFFGTGVVGGMWLALIGWFLNNAALMSHRQLLARRSLEGVPVSSMMLSSFASVPAGTSIAAFVDDYLIASDQRTYPVLEGGRLVGLVSLEDVRKVAPAERSVRTVEDIMTPASELATVAPGAPAAEALRQLAGTTQAQLPVVADGEVRGLLRREDVVKWMSLHGPGQGFAGRA
jgi:Zn-dependent protease/CBS domain-containing protein